MNNQPPIKSVSNPSSNPKPAVNLAVVSAAQQTVVQTAVRRADPSRADQPAEIIPAEIIAAEIIPAEIIPAEIIVAPHNGGDTSSGPPSNQRQDNPRPVDAEFLPETGLAAVSPVSLDEAISLSLTPPQRLAIQLLTSGKSLVAAATAAGVNRTTLYRWLKGDAAFVAAYNAWQRDVRDTARGKVLALSDLAITTIAKAMTKGDTRPALKILEATGALTHEEPGSTDPVEIQRLQKIERIKAQTALRRAENRAEMDAEMPI